MIIPAIFLSVVRFKVNIIMKPMDENSTQFLQYRDIIIDDIDLISNAWGFDQQFSQVFAVLDLICNEPDENMVSRLISDINGK